jgi:hypothetical protein
MVMGYKDQVDLLLITEKSRSFGISLTKEAARQLADYLNAAIDVSEGYVDGEVSGVKWG